jgi:hypothetical protein
MYSLSQIVAQIGTSNDKQGLEAVLSMFDQLDPEQSGAEADFYNGLVLFRLERPNSGVFFERSAKADPSNPDPILYWGLTGSSHPLGSHARVAFVRDRIKESIHVAIARGTPWSNLEFALNAHAGQCMTIGPLPDAEASYRMLLQLKPDNPSYLLGLAKALSTSGKMSTLAELTEIKSALDKALALQPDLAEASEELEAVNEALKHIRKKARVTKIGKFPEMSEMKGDVADVIRNTITLAIPKIPFIERKTQFATLGSCFAREIARKLIQKGFLCKHFEVSEYINSTYANRYMIDWAVDQCTGQVKERLDQLFGEINITPSELLGYFVNSDAIIYTLGVAPAFFSREDQTFIMPKGSSLNARALSEKYQFRTTSVAENVENLNYIHSRIKEFRGGREFKFILTVSPVPLRASFEYESAVIADCISKSTLRVVAHEFLNSADGEHVLYWPSFEIVRWLGTHMGPFYGVDDGASWHISSDLIHAITDSFIEHFSVT